MLLVIIAVGKKQNAQSGRRYTRTPHTIIQYLLYVWWMQTRSLRVTYCMLQVPRSYPEGNSRCAFDHWGRREIFSTGGRLSREFSPRAWASDTLVDYYTIVFASAFFGTDRRERFSRLRAPSHSAIVAQTRPADIGVSVWEKKFARRT